MMDIGRVPESVTRSDNVPYHTESLGIERTKGWTDLQQQRAGTLQDEITTM
jgi:hypothetical protein